MRNFRLDDESGHQEALFEWVAYHMDCMPELEYMHQKWQVFLNDQGYYAVICYGWREAAKVIEEYLLKADNDKAAAVLQEMGK